MPNKTIQKTRQKRFKVSKINIKNLFLALILLLIAIIIGNREYGFDYINYQKIISRYISATEQGSDLSEILKQAKDPLFALIIEISVVFEDREKFVFIIVAILSILTKFFAVKKIIPKNVFYYCLIYLIFISPGLEFAAIRSGLGIGFLLLAIAHHKNRKLFVIFSLMSIASHISMLVPVVLTLAFSRKIFSKHRIYNFFLINLAIIVFGKSLVSLNASGAAYLGNQGTIYAFIHPLLFSTIVVLAMGANKLKLPNYGLHIISSVVIVITISSFGLTYSFVTIATRYIEIAMPLLLILVLGPFKLQLDRSTVALALLMAYLTFNNITRGTWLAIIDKGFLQ